ncbi:MAG TPA: hypothetical protein VMM93_00815 [Vicinamibacterales bacterium]|nr:hypothetical protein [Vicinamibacterales bacterium]
MTRLPFIAGVVIWISVVGLAAARDAGTSGLPPAAPVMQTVPAGVVVPATECVACHNNLTSPAGEDVSIGASWRGSIMANAARDPYFFASVRRETIDHPTHAAMIEDECAACHMPGAQRALRAAGGLGRLFSLAPWNATGADPMLEAIAADGVTCTVCHQISTDGLGTRASFNGGFTLAAPLASGRRPIFGPFAPDTGLARIMHSVTGYEQVQAVHIRESEMCATCHTLITQAFGPDGSVIGSLPEQMNYQEWQHSAFVGEGRSCQSCHMPLVQGPVRVSSVLGVERETLSRHTFLGGNAFMLRLMNRYRAELGIEATPAELEATAQATIRQLQEQTATVVITNAEAFGDGLQFDVEIANLTGHKFPTGYPSRRTWLHVTVRSADGRTLFESGRVSPTGAIDGNDSDASDRAFEPHYREITRADQVQIYEAIMGDAAGRLTTGLHTATQYLKDNRLLPRGFDKATAPDEIAVVGDARPDPDFQAAGDRTRYRLPLPAAGPLTIDVELLYQPIAYRWARNLEAYRSATEPQRFLEYYDAMAPGSAVVVGRASVGVGVKSP